MARLDGTVGHINEASLGRDVQWRDLVRYRRVDTVVELLLPAP